MSLAVRKNMFRSVSSVAMWKDMRVPNVKSFEEIPGPRPLPYIGNMWRYFPIIGSYSLDKIHHSYAKMHAQYGPLVREFLHEGRTIVHVFDPYDMEKVYKNEGKFPLRISHRAVAKYRNEKPHIYASPGLFPSNGCQWKKFRSKFQHILMTPDGPDTISGVLEDVTEDLLATIVSKLDENEETDIQPLLFNWALESIGAVTLNRRLGCLSAEGNKEAKALVEAAQDIHVAVFMTENNPLSYKKYYKKLVQAEEYFERVVRKYMEVAIEEIKKGKNSDSILAQMLRDGEIEKKEITTMILDMFMAGIDTTANALAFAFYNLAINPYVQEKLRAELLLNLPTKKRRLSATEPRLHYLNRVIYENFRVNPVAFGNGRVIPDDLVLSGYRVPARTMVVLQHQVACMQEKYFPDPKTFNPEREVARCPMLVSSPFGYGKRMCIGSRIARTELKLAIARVMRSFKISYHYDPIDSFNRLINVPDKPVRLRFQAIDE